MPPTHPRSADHKHLLDRSVNLIENQWRLSADPWRYIGTPRGQEFVVAIGEVVRGHQGYVVFLRR